MKKRIGIVSTIILGGLIAASANAETFDGTLASPDTNAPTADTTPGNPSYYNGSGPGNPQNGWTIDAENGIELGLRAKLRFDSNAIQSPTDTYVVPYGTGGSPARALWNYEFSIDLQPNGVGSLTLGDISASLKISDITPGHLATTTVDPLTHWTDNTGFGTTNGNTNVTFSIGTNGAEWGAQNSENPSFGDFPLAGSFDPNVDDTYEFTLSVSQGQTVLAADTIDVVVSPEPSTWILLASGGLALFFVQRRRRSIA